MPTKFVSLKLGVAFGLFKCSYKTLYLEYKSKLWIYLSQMSLLVQNNQNILENTQVR